MSSSDEPDASPTDDVPIQTSASLTWPQFPGLRRRRQSPRDAAKQEQDPLVKRTSHGFGFELCVMFAIYAVILSALIVAIYIYFFSVPLRPALQSSGAV